MQEHSWWQAKAALPSLGKKGVNRWGVEKEWKEEMYKNISYIIEKERRVGWSVGTPSLKDLHSVVTKVDYNDETFRRNADAAWSIHLSGSRTMSTEFRQKVAVRLEDLNAMVTGIGNLIPKKKSNEFF